MIRCAKVTTFRATQGQVPDRIRQARQNARKDSLFKKLRPVRREANEYGGPDHDVQPVPIGTTCCEKRRPKITASLNWRGLLPETRHALRNVPVG